MKGKSAEMIGVLTGVATICGVLIVGAYQTTLPLINANKAAYLKAAVFKVIPGAVKTAAFTVDADGSLTPAGEGQPAAAHAVYDENGGLLGIALEASGQGFQEIIRVLYGYSPAQRAVVGFMVLESKETPGLGDKIEKDPAFLANFNALDVALDAGGDQLAHPITVVKPGKKTSAWEIDAISGATISSKAIGRLLDESTRVKIPLVHRNLQRLKEGAGG
ncbi:MAG: FMN-binding protein [Elusimicrobiota bacterium]